MMHTAIPPLGQPIRSLQNFLRRISQSDPEIPSVIPDGQYTKDTQSAVLAFQQRHGLPMTGRVDNDTWDSIVTAYDTVLEQEDPPQNICLYPSAFFVVRPGDRNIHLYAILAVLKALTVRYPHLGGIELGNVYTPACVPAVQNLQRIYDMEATGNIDKRFWEHTSRLYSAVISEDRFVNTDLTAIVSEAQADFSTPLPINVPET